MKATEECLMSIGEALQILKRLPMGVSVLKIDGELWLDYTHYQPKGGTT